MKKLILIFSLFVFVGFSSAGTPFSEKENRDLDQHLELLRSMSSKEKNEKADYYARLEAKSATIRQAFSPSLSFKSKVHLSEAELRIVQKRVQDLKKLSKAEQEKQLALIEEVQVFAHELLRSLSLERSKDFAGYATTKLPTPLFRFPVEEVDINKSFGGVGMLSLNLDQQNLIREVAVVLPPQSVVLLMKKVQV